MSNWKIPRSTILEMAILAYRRGWYATLDQSVRYMTRFHYRGKSPAIARGILYVAAMDRFYHEHGGRTEEQQRIHDMARELRSEGWRLIDNENGYLWRHDPTGLMPSYGGGIFSRFADATSFVFDSETRSMLNNRSENNE